MKNYTTAVDTGIQILTKYENTKNIFIGRDLNPSE